MLNTTAMTGVITLTMSLALSMTRAKGEEPVATIRDTAEQRLTYMQSAGESYAVTLDTHQPVTFRRDPVLRFTNPVSGVVDGGLFVWQVPGGRPVAIAQFFIAPGTDQLWIHEFQSLTAALDGTSRGAMTFKYGDLAVWSPNTPGLEFKPIDGASPPAKSAVARMTQMRQIVRRFSVKDDFEGTDDDELRILSTPLVRYADAMTIDGALFSFAHGTDPELLVAIEASAPSGTDSGATGWRVALAPMTSYAITAELDQVVYWSVPWRKAPHPINAIFKNFVYPPSP